MLHNTVGLQRKLGLNNVFILAKIKPINKLIPKKRKKKPGKTIVPPPHLPLQESTGKYRTHKAGQRHQKDFKLMHAPTPHAIHTERLRDSFFLNGQVKL